MLIEMSGMPKNPAELLVDLQSTCQLVLLHTWFSRGSRLPFSDPCVPRSKDELECLLNDLSIATEVVCMHPDHADAHRDVYTGMMALVVGTLNSAFAESALLKFLGLCDRRAMEQDLSHLRLLVKNSSATWTPVQRTAA